MDFSLVVKMILHVSVYHTYRSKGQKRVVAMPPLSYSVGFGSTADDAVDFHQVRNDL